ncbi:class I adenylate-forming enzyme family protein [Ruixingdingia sedimenti]|uniref:AMP-binding protein n=1 Tax=Ruixingdingia sedimenti TaxID=3073604 RepID=A0ABU1F6S0_9RHOB|nr:AMP-binding protein [Xinfangfangia sp. LG-4]MDR5652572.1 AMP-binding protein [Xinfangfangia sp. LG-4]
MTPEALAPLTIRDLIAARAAQDPGGFALSVQAWAGGRRRYGFADLDRLADRMAGALWAMGLRPGDRLAVFLTNDAGREFMLTALGALALGGVVVALNTRAADTELAANLDLVEPAFLLTDPASAPRFAALAPALRQVVIGAGWPDPEDAPALPYERAISPDALGCLLFTSGTTARPKAVMASQRTMIAAGMCCGAALGLRAGDVYQAGFPLFTSSVLNIAAMSAWVAGAGLVLEGMVDNDERLRLIGAEGTNFYHGVPSVLHFMQQAFDPARHDLSRVRRIASGGAPLPPEVARRLRETWPGADQVQIYGLTESGPAGTVLYPEERAAHPGSIGRAMPHCRIEIVDDAGHPLPPGAEGEIAVTSPAVALGYYRDPQATARAFAGRRVLTGDAGVLDGDGFLSFRDRKKDIINRGGLKIASVAVEQVLYRHPAVKEAAVVAVPHPDLGEDVAAFVVLHDGQGADIAALRAHCARDLADYAVPRKWHFIDALPKNPMGKVLKTDLRDMARG